MKTDLSQRGQVVIGVLILLGLLAWVVIAMMANAPGMARGAETIGSAVGDAIDDAAYQQYQQEMQILDWQVANGTVVSAWINQQRIPPNPQAIQHHSDLLGAQIAIQCYNDHGVFFIQANKAGDWYFHCLEEDGKTVRTTFWQKVGKQFHLKTAYTKGDGAWSWSQIRTFFESKWGATKASFPSDGILYVDEVPAPFIGQ